MHNTVHTVGQDGNKHYLLCGECEDASGRDEDYLARLMRGTATSLASIGVDAAGGVLHGVDPQRVLHALGAIVLRCHHCPSSPFQDFTLSHELETIVRAMIEDPLGTPLHVWANRWVSLMRINTSVLVIPRLEDYDGHRYIELQFGGWSWRMMTTELEMPFDLPPDVRSRPWIVETADVTGSYFWQQHANGVVGLTPQQWEKVALKMGAASAADLMPGPGAECMCESSLAFEAGCASLWGVEVSR